MQETALEISRVVRAAPERAFAAWTTPELLMRWWGPESVSCPEAHVDLRRDGEYRLANQYPDGSIVWIFGRFTEIVPPEKLVYTWNISNVPSEPTLVTVRFLQHDEGTEIVLSHTRFHEEALRDMHLQGWGGCLDGLVTLLNGS